MLSEDPSHPFSQISEKVKIDDAVEHNDEAKRENTENCVNGKSKQRAQDILEDPDFECDDGCRKKHESIKKLLAKSCRPDRELIESHVHGRVKWFDTRLEYGFITRADTGEDIFLHASGVLDIRPGKHLRDVGKNERVIFDVVRGKKGGKAVNLSGHRGQPVLGNPLAMDWMTSLKKDFGDSVDRYKLHTYFGPPRNKIWSCWHRGQIDLQRAIIINQPTLNTKPSETYQTATDTPYDLKIVDTSNRPDIQGEIRQARNILFEALCQDPCDGCDDYEKPSIDGIDEEGWAYFKEDPEVDDHVQEMVEMCMNDIELCSIRAKKLAPESFPYTFFVTCKAEAHFELEVFSHYRGPVYWNTLTREFMMDDDQPVENYDPGNEDKLIFNGLKPIMIYEGGEKPFTVKKLVEEVAKLDYNPGDHRFLENIFVQLRQLDGEPAMTIMFFCGS